MRTTLSRALTALLLSLSLLSLTPASAQTSLGVQGPVPVGLPNRLMVGLFEEAGQTWMRDSAVPWDVRYRYLTKGWADNWGWGAYDGDWARTFFQESKTQGFLPAAVFYQLFAEPGGGEGESLAKVQNATTMRGYFNDVKLLLQRAKELGSPVLVLVEPDAYGLLQHQTHSNPNAYAAVADTGMPELANLPNTVAGWGLAFLQLRKSVGASNVILGMHVSAWASGKDIACCSVTDPLQPEVDKVASFLKPLGLGSNTTGATYDVLVGDPLDRDADFYKLTRGEDRWWDASDSASISSRSFNRYAEWLRLMNQSTGKRWVLWQIPLGNSHHRNVENDGSPSAGYRDNRTEYFFGPSGDAHRRKFANSGVIALLFGAGAGGQSSFQNDLAADGLPYMRARAGTFLQAGGLTLPAAGTTLPGTGGSSTGGTDAGTPATRGYGFESGTEGWATSSAQLRAVSTSTTRAFSGTRSLAVPFSGTSGTGVVAVPGAQVPRGATVTFRIWIPRGSRITSIQPFALEDASSGWRYTGRWAALTSLKAGAWNTVTVTLPATSTTPLHQLGVELTTSGSWTGTVYLDGISW